MFPPGNKKPPHGRLSDNFLSVGIVRLSLLQEGITMRQPAQPTKEVIADEEGSQLATHRTFDTGLCRVSFALDPHRKDDHCFCRGDVLEVRDTRPNWRRTVQLDPVYRYGRYR
ncbi:MAG: hypothetical protein ACN6P5_19860 [Pseudomonas protegens]